ncbi:hypothetical protein GEMRC1_011194 [Eukaryota sp. GEM-RC1]
MLASHSLKLEIIKILVEYGAVDHCETTDFTHKNCYSLLASVDHSTVNMALQILDFLIFKFRPSTQVLTRALYCAKHPRVIDFLLSHGAKLNCDESLCSHNNSCIKHLRSKNLKISGGLSPCLCPQGHPLLFAIRDDKIEVVEYLVSLPSFNVNVYTLLGWSSAMVACQYNRTAMLTILIDSGADLFYTDAKQHDCLYVCCKFGSLECLQLLFQHDTDVIGKFKTFENALFVAVSNGHVDVSKYLISKGFDVNFTDAEGNSLLNVAVAKHYSKICNLLCEHPEINPNIPNISGHTPLLTLFTLENPSLAMFNLLIENEADGDCKTETKQSILHLVAQLDPFSNKITILNTILTQYSHLINDLDIDGNLALHFACQVDCSQSVSSLLSRESEVNIANNLGKFPINYAVQNNKTIIVDLLCRFGSVVDCVDDVINHQWFKSLKILLVYGAKKPSPGKYSNIDPELDSILM